MEEEVIVEESPILTDMSVRQLVQILLTGGVVGAATWGLSWLFDVYVFKSLVCHGVVCDGSAQYGVIFGSIVAASIGLLALVKLQVFRPLLVVLAVTISLWGSLLNLSHLPWYTSLLFSVGIFVVTYGAFAWLARLRMFWLMIVLFGILIAVMRLMLY